MLIASVLILPIYGYLSIPKEQIVAMGENPSLNNWFPENLQDKISLKIKNNQNIPTNKAVLSSSQSNALSSSKGTFDMSVMLFGLIPIKDISVSVVPEMKLYPGGQAVGVLLRTKGVLTVGISPVIDKNSKSHSPAEDAGIDVGDSIIAVNDKAITTDEELAELINDYGASNEKITLTMKKENVYFKKTIKPIKCYQTNTFRIGLLVKDNAGGVGTLTFYDPLTNKYGALGHMISDVDTNQQIVIKQGKLIKANIEGINAGKKGYPGEKIGNFIKDSDLGNIEVNSYCGIFGKMNNNIATQTQEPLPVGFSHQIETGPAEIYTVLSGEKIEKFAINVDKVMLGKKDGKEMVIRITDPKLLETTGGIIQGMSGSPIVQNGKIIGAVTHVFINDPTRGYGVFIEDMLIEAGILTGKKQEKLGA